MLFNDKMIFAEKQSVDFYTRKAKRTLCPGWSTVFSKAEKIVIGERENFIYMWHDLLTHKIHAWEICYFP